MHVEEQKPFFCNNKKKIIICADTANTSLYSYNT